MKSVTHYCMRTWMQNSLFSGVQREMFTQRVWQAVFVANAGEVNLSQLQPFLDRNWTSPGEKLPSEALGKLQRMIYLKAVFQICSSSPPSLCLRMPEHLAALIGKLPPPILTFWQLQAILCPWQRLCKRSIYMWKINRSPTFCWRLLLVEHLCTIWHAYFDSSHFPIVTRCTQFHYKYIMMPGELKEFWQRIQSQSVASPSVKAHVDDGHLRNSQI